MKLYLRAYSSWSTQILQKCISCFFPSVVNLYWSRSRSGISIIFSRIIMLSPAGTPLGASGPRSGFLTGSTGRRWGRSLLFLSRWKNVRCSRGRWKILFTCNEKNLSNHNETHPTGRRWGLRRGLLFFLGWKNVKCSRRRCKILLTLVVYFQLLHKIQLE